MVSKGARSQTEMGEWGRQSVKGVSPSINILLFNFQPFVFPFTDRGILLFSLNEPEITYATKVMS